MNTYSFRTSKGWRIDVSAGNARSAYRAVLEIAKGMSSRAKDFYGVPSKYYIRYNKEGIASIYDWKPLK